MMVAARRFQDFSSIFRRVLNRSRRDPAQRGEGVFPLLIYGLIAVLIIGGFSYVGSVGFGYVQRIFVTGGINSMVSAIRANSNGGYGTANLTSSLVTNQAVPFLWNANAAAGTLTFYLGGVVVTPVGNTNTFTLTVTGMTETICSGVGQGVSGSTSITVNSTAFTAALTQAQAIATCTVAASGNTGAWVF